MLAFSLVHDLYDSDNRHYRQELLVPFVTFFDRMRGYLAWGNGMPTNFSKILEDLREWGLNDYKMSELTGIERSKLSKFRTGDRKQPTYDDGCAIMKVYNREKKNSHTNED